MGGAAHTRKVEFFLQPCLPMTMKLRLITAVVLSSCFGLLAGFAQTSGAASVSPDLKTQLTPATLAQWNVAGAVSSADPALGTITVPAGGQLGRTYPVGKIVVSLASRPFFSTKATNSPALEVGPATLTFLRNEAGGGIVMLGDRALSLPNSIPLAPDGRSVRPLALVFGYDPARNEAVLSLDGSSYALAATQRSAQLEVAVSAGAEAAWTISNLEVTASGGATGPSLASGGSSSSSSSADQAQSRGLAVDRGQAYIEARDNFSAGQDEKALAALVAGNSRKPASPAWPMANAQALVRLAMEFSSQGRTATADRIAQKALQAIDRVVAQASAGEGDLAADAQELAGLIKLRFLGDAAAARASYREALRLSPLNTAAREGLGHLEKAEAEAAKKGRGHGGT